MLNLCQLDVARAAVNCNEVMLARQFNKLMPTFCQGRSGSGVGWFGLFTSVMLTGLTVHGAIMSSLILNHYADAQALVQIFPHLNVLHVLPQVFYEGTAICTLCKIRPSCIAC